MGRTRRFLIAVCAAVALLAAGSLIVLRSGRPLYYTDGQSGIIASALVDAPMLVWNRPEPDSEIPGPIRGRVQPLPDGRLVYGRVLANGTTDLVVFDPRRPALEPLPLTMLNSSRHDLAPALDAEGNLLFASDRDGGVGGFDLYVATRFGDGSFGPPRPLTEAINSLSDEIDPAPAPSGGGIVFVRRLAGIADGRNGTLMIADRESEAPARSLWPAEPAARAGLDTTPIIDRDPAFAPDGLALWFVRQRLGGPPVVHTTWPHRGQFVDPVPIPILSAAGYRAPHPIEGGYAVQLLAPGDAPLLYRADARLVYPWWAGQHPLEFFLLLVLLLALVLLTLLILGARWRKLDIITWCILLSLLIHLLVLLWLAGVEIMKHSELEPAFEERLAIRLVSARAGGAVDATGEVSQQRDSIAERVRFDRKEVALEAAVPDAGLQAAESPDRTPDGEDAGRTVTPTRTAAPAAFDDAADPVERLDGNDALATSAERTVSVSPDAIEVAAAPRADHATAEIVVDVPAPNAVSEAASRPVRRPIAVGERAAVVPIRHPLATTAPAIHDPAATVVVTAEPVAEALQPSSSVDTRAARAAAAVAPPTIERPDAPRRGAGDIDASRPRPEQASAVAAARRRDVDGDRRTRTASPTRDVGSLAQLRDLPEPVPEPAAAAVASEDLPDLGMIPPAPLVAADAEISAARTLRPLPGPSASDAARPRPELRDLPIPTRAMDAPAERIAPALTRTDDASPRVVAVRDVELGPQPPPELADESRRWTDAAAAPLAAVESADALAPSRPERGDRGRGGRELVSSGIQLPPSFLGPAPRRAASMTAMPAVAASRGLYSNRFGPAKTRALERFGGTEETEQAVANGLRYLASVQTQEGNWGRRTRRHEKYGETYVGKTALCVLAYLGAGHTHRSRTEYSDHVGRALTALLRTQDDETGHFGRTSAYSHGITTYALAECFAITGDESLRAPLERAVRWIVRQQNQRGDRRNLGGWGYFSPTLAPEDRFARSSVSSWMVMALKSAQLSGIEVSDDVLARARRFFGSMFDEDRAYFLYTKEPGRLRMSWRTLPASTPASVFCLLLLGESPGEYPIRAGLEYTVERAPRRYRSESEDAFVLRGAGNVYFWYYGSLACFLAGGDEWEDWNDALKRVLPPAQNDDGSWTPVGAYASYADDTRRDRSYTTAMIVLSLEVYYRYFTPLLDGR